MKIKFSIPAIIITSFLVGCSDNQNEQPQESNQVNAITKTAPLVSPKQDQAPTTETIKTSSSLNSKPQSKEPITQKQIEQDAKALAKALAYEGDTTPQKDLEQELKKILEAANAESAATETQ